MSQSPVLKDSQELQLISAFSYLLLINLFLGVCWSGKA